MTLTPEQRAALKATSKILADAEKISTIVLNTNTDVRHELFKEVAVQLAIQAQGYTAKLFLDMAKRYANGD